LNAARSASCPLARRDANVVAHYESLALLLVLYSLPRLNNTSGIPGASMTPLFFKQTPSGPPPFSHFVHGAHMSARGQIEYLHFFFSSPLLLVGELFFACIIFSGKLWSTFRRALFPGFLTSSFTADSFLGRFGITDSTAFWSLCVSDPYTRSFFQRNKALSILASHLAPLYALISLQPLLFPGFSLVRLPGGLAFGIGAVMFCPFHALLY